jgi:hypothetical protein
VLLSSEKSHEPFKKIPRLAIHRAYISSLSTLGVRRTVNETIKLSVCPQPHPPMIAHLAACRPLVHNLQLPSLLALATTTNTPPDHATRRRISKETNRSLPRTHIRNIYLIPLPSSTIISFSFFPDLSTSFSSFANLELSAPIEVKDSTPTPSLLPMAFYPEASPSFLSSRGELLLHC